MTVPILRHVNLKRSEQMPQIKPDATYHGFENDKDVIRIVIIYLLVLSAQILRTIHASVPLARNSFHADVTVRRGVV